MRKHLWFWLTLVLAAAALVASAILLVDYVRPLPVFCDEGGGCAKLKETVFARPFGIPLPAIGLSGILAIALSALIPGRIARTAQLLLSAIGAVFGICLIWIQVRLGTVCPFCAVVDGASILLAVVAVLRRKKEWDPPSGRLVPGLAAVGMLVAIGVPLAVGFQRRVIPKDVPAVIAEENARTERGKVTIVDFVDFECPYCRITHDAFAPLLESRKAKVRVVRKYVPLRVHPHAMDAAKAGYCGETLGKGDEMADALFKAPPEELTPDGCEEIARRVGLDLARFQSCVKDPSTLARIEKDREAFRASNGKGLPTIFIDGVRLSGGQERETLETTLDSAIRTR